MTNFLASPIKYLPNFLNMYFEATPVQVLSSTLIQSLVRDFHTHIWFQVLRWEKFKPSWSLLQSRPFINLGVCVTPQDPKEQWPQSGHLLNRRWNRFQCWGCPPSHKYAHISILQARLLHNPFQSYFSTARKVSWSTEASSSMRARPWPSFLNTPRLAPRHGRHPSRAPAQ